MDNNSANETVNEIADAGDDLWGTPTGLESQPDKNSGDAQKRICNKERK